MVIAINIIGSFIITHLLTDNFLTEVCHGVEIEPHLQPLTGSIPLNDLPSMVTMPDKTSKAMGEQ